MKQYTVITSKSAKDHINMARTAMNDMQNSMFVQSNMLKDKKLQENNIALEDRKTEMANQHEMAMQRDKLMGVATLI